MPDAGNSKRRVGVEIEFSGLSVPETVDIVRSTLGGEAETEGTFRVHVRGTRIGDLLVELDTRYAKKPDDPGLIDQLIDAVATRDDAAQLLSDVMPVPIEIVTAPLEPDGFAALDSLTEALRDAGAVGTKGGTLYAYGLHLNIEHLGPIGDAIRIAAAYSFAERWLRHRLGPDNARRFTPFIDPMPTGFIIALAERMGEGEIGLEEFTALYGRFNPRRNRGLDMWPLLGHVDRALAARHHSGPLPPTRPAFHYRLPDSRVDQPGWAPHYELEQWDIIERAASDPDVLETLRRTALEYNRGRIARGVYFARLDEVLK